MRARAVHTYFIGTESEERLCRTLDHASRKVHIVGIVDFRPCKTHELSSISTLINGLSRKS